MSNSAGISTIAADSEAAVAAAGAGLGPLFGSIQPHLLETPQNFIDDPVPLIAKAASARLAYLDAERAANDKSMTPAALKRFTDREIERMEEAQAGFELRVAERVTTLERRCEAGEEAVHAAVERCGERLLTQTKLLAAELHERSAAEQCEKLAAMATRFELAQTAAAAAAAALEARLAQLELRVLPGSGLGLDEASLFAKLGFPPGVSADEVKSDLASRQRLEFGSLGLTSADARCLAALLASLGPAVDFTALDLDGNPLGNAGLAALVAPLEAGALNSLEELGIAHCGFGYPGLHALASAWARSRPFRLKALRLGGIRTGGPLEISDVVEELALLHGGGLCRRLAYCSLNAGAIDLSGANLVCNDPILVKDAFKLSARPEAGQLAVGHGVVLVTGARRAIARRNDVAAVLGSNPYYQGADLHTAFLHMCGLDAGVVRIEDAGKGVPRASTAHGVSTKLHERELEMYKLTLLASFE